MKDTAFSKPANFHRQGILFVVSAPSGAGKTTLCENLRTTPDLIQIVTCTTRPPRPGEESGVDYHFLKEDQFKKLIEKNELLEYAQVHDHFYGTPKETVKAALQAGTDVLLAIDVQGAAAIRASGDPLIQSSLADVFIMPPTVDELERRLRKRGSDTEEQIALRLENARKEMRRWQEYKYTILSSSMEEDLTKFRAILRAERYLSRRLTWNP